MENTTIQIIDFIKKESSKDPIAIFNHAVKQSFVHMHGPEHHIIDGACVLMAYHNAGGQLDLDEALNALIKRASSMPGAMCGYWGVCGAVTSVGAALSIIDGTGPLSSDGSWGEHMRYTSSVISKMAEINGPRCCKRDGYLALLTAVDYLNQHKDVQLLKSEVTCSFSHLNAQCIKERCPFHQK